MTAKEKTSKSDQDEENPKTEGLEFVVVGSPDEKIGGTGTGGDGISEKENGTTAVVDNSTILRNEMETESATKASTSSMTGDETIRNEQRTLELPNMCYCPISKEIMRHPVVNREGDSFEESAIVERDNAEQNFNSYYPNRALRAYIEREVERISGAGSVMGTLRRLDEDLRTGLDRWVEHHSALQAVVGEEHRPLPDAFYCPITFDLIREPVIDADGYTYEKSAIERWIHKNHDSPVTRKSLLMSELYDNNAVLSILLLESDKPAGTIHPSLRRWKEELLSPPPPPFPIEEDPATDGESNSGDYGIPSTGFVVVIPQGHRDYPTTYEELRERRKQRRFRQLSLVCSMILIAVTAVGMLLLHLPLYWVIFVMAVICCMYAKRSAARMDSAQLRD